MTAALTAADLGLSVVVVEKAGSFGGSTARSGGGIWAPGNAVLRAAGVTDTPDQARAYLAHVAGADVPAGLREAFLEHGPAMLDLVLARTPLRLAWVPGYADYYPEAPGGLACGRSVEPVPMDGRRAGRRAGPAEPALPADPGRGGDHPGRLPVAEPGAAASARDPGRGAGRGAGRARPGDRAPDAQPRAGAGRGAAGRAARAAGCRSGWTPR